MAACIVSVDDAVGSVVSSLTQAGMMANSLIVLSTDNVRSGLAELLGHRPLCSPWAAKQAWLIRAGRQTERTTTT